MTTNSALHFEPSLANLERFAAIGSGGLLLMSGAMRRSASGWCLALLSAPFLYRGVTGQWPRRGRSNRSAHDDAREALAGDRGLHVRESIRLECPLDEVYRFWRELDNLPKFMTHLVRVTETEPGRSHWVAKGPGGVRVEWNAEIFNEVENKILAWRSLPGLRRRHRRIRQFRQRPRRPEHAGQREPAVRRHPPAGPGASSHSCSARRRRRPSAKTCGASSS